MRKISNLVTRNLLRIGLEKEIKRQALKMRFSFIFIMLAVSFASSLFGKSPVPQVPSKVPTKVPTTIPTKAPTKPVPAPTTPSQPVYGYPGYYPSYPHSTPTTAPKIYTAKEQREEARKAFDEKNDSKNSMTGQTRRSKPVKQDKTPEKKTLETMSQ